MRYWIRFAAVAASFVCGVAAQGQTLHDVPGGHWARQAALEVVQRGVMNAPGGKFDGRRTVTRTELAVTLANLARSLEQGAWPKTGSKPSKPGTTNGDWRQKPVTRYELAVLLSRAARYAMAGLPKSTGKVFGASEALPPPVKISSVPKSHPAYASLAYLAKNRMIWPKSVLRQPGAQPVTGAQVVDALAQMIGGLIDRLTDEPQNREDLSPPPDHRRD